MRLPRWTHLNGACDRSALGVSPGNRVQALRADLERLVAAAGWVSGHPLEQRAEVYPVLFSLIGSLRSLSR